MVLGVLGVEIYLVGSGLGVVGHIIYSLVVVVGGLIGGV